MISTALARRLREHGLVWRPALHDFFHIPDRGLDDRLFVLADLMIDVEELAGHSAIMFNGAVEWSLDYILGQEVVWMPTEEQLREQLADRFVGLEAVAAGHRCRFVLDGNLEDVTAGTASDAYGLALLRVLQDGG